MSIKLFIQVSCIIIIAASCSANKSEDDIIEARTDLTTIEITNYFPNNSISIKSGYVKQTLVKIDFETYSIVNEEYTSSNTNNPELFFDSLAFELIKKVLDLDYINHENLTILIRNNQSEIRSTNKNMMFIGIITGNENSLLATLEVPIDQSLNSSVVKIWTYDLTTNLLQINSVLKANSNRFDFINIKNNSILLSDDVFIYRLVLDNEHRFEKNMDILVSMDAI